MGQDLLVETRLALLVGALVESPRHEDHLPVMSPADVRMRLPFYRWTPGNDKEEKSQTELFQADVNRLIARGLVRRLGTESTDLVQLTIPEKPERLFLEEEEHQAMAQARLILRPDAGPPLISPYRLSVSFGEDQTIADNAMDVAWAVARYLEEMGGQIEIAALAEYLEAQGIPHASRVANKAFTILDYTSEHLALDAMDPGLEFEGTNRKNSGILIQPGEPPRQRENRRHSHGGLNGISRQAYTPDEARERLELIAEGLAPDSPLSDELKGPLRSAKYKISDWLHLVTSPRGIP